MEFSICHKQLREAFPFAQLPRYLLRDRMRSLAMTFQNTCDTWASAKFCRHHARLGSEPISSGWLAPFVANASIIWSCPRKLATKNAAIVLRVLPPIENASFVGKGRAGATSNSPARNGIRR